MSAVIVNAIDPTLIPKVILQIACMASRILSLSLIIRCYKFAFPACGRVRVVFGSRKSPQPDVPFEPSRSPYICCTHRSAMLAVGRVQSENGLSGE